MVKIQAPDLLVSFPLGDPRRQCLLSGSYAQRAVDKQELSAIKHSQPKRGKEGSLLLGI